MGWFDPPHTAVLKKLPPELARGAQIIQQRVEADCSHLDATDRSFCVVLGLAAWVFELDQKQASGMLPNQLAYVYEAGRLAAKGMRRKDVLPYLDKRLSKLGLSELMPDPS